MSPAESWYTPESPRDREVGGERSLSELFSDMAGSLEVLLRKEVELAKAELREQASRAGRAAGMMAGAAVTGLVAFLVLALAAAWGLAEVLPTGLAFLIVGLVLAAVAGGMAVAGRNRAASVRPVPQQTVQNIREDMEAAKTSLSRGAKY